MDRGRSRTRTRAPSCKRCSTPATATRSPPGSRSGSQFGTAGLRGALGAGPNRMNVAVVRAASAGLGALDHDADRAAHVASWSGTTTAIAPRGSRATTAAVLAAAGIPVRLATRPWPTPVTAYAVAALQRGRGRDGDREPQSCARQRLQGLRRTPARRSSHRSTPQIAAAHRSRRSRERDRVRRPTRRRIEPARRRRGRRVSRRRGARASRPACARATCESSTRRSTASDSTCSAALWERAGFDAAAGRRRSRRNPTPTSRPRRSRTPRNPVSSTSRSTSRRATPRRPRARATIPTPTASRSRSPHGGGWRVLTGDEIGALLGARMLATSTGDDRVVARSIVSSRLLDRIADAAGVPARATLTGFKWISRAGDADGRRLVFGYEEALGYAVTPRVRDKDGLTAALAIADLAARGSLDRALDRARRGARSARNRAVVDALRRRRRRRRRSPPAFAPHRRRSSAVCAVTSRPSTTRSASTAFRRPTCSSSSSPTAAACCVRPSGTEPKVKCYFEVVEASTRPRASGDPSRRTSEAFQETAGPWS